MHKESARRGRNFVTKEKLRNMVGVDFRMQSAAEGGKTEFASLFGRLPTDVSKEARCHPHSTF